MSDVVFIEGLRVDTVIGVYDWERVILQKLVIDAQLSCDISQAAASDDVAYVIDYQAVCDDIERICVETKAQLLETLAQKIATHILQNYPCHAITLSIHKPDAVKQAASVGVKISRSK